MSEMVFLHHLSTAPTVTVTEGIRAVEMLFQGQRSVAVIWGKWKLGYDSVLDKGTLAYMLRTACDFPQSINEVVLVRGLGLGDRRYALKTCIYEGIMPYGRADEPVTGGELLSALRAAESSRNCRPSTSAE